MRPFRTLFILAIAFLVFSNNLLAQSNQNNVTLFFAGDVNLARHLKKHLNERWTYPFKNIPWFKDADISVVNLENPLTTAENARKKKYVFKAPPHFARILKLGGVDLVNIANNHIYDYGAEGLLQTLNALEKEDLKYVGAGRNIEEARKPAIFLVKGLKIGFLAYYGVNAHEECHPATVDSPGTALRQLRVIRSDVRKLRPQVDFLVVIFHWGFEKEHIPRQHQIDFAHRVIDYGTDLVVGHHPHVLQGIEKYGDGVIVYSLGDFIFGGRYTPYYESAVLKVTLPVQDLKEWNVEVIPVGVKYWQPARLQGARADSVLKQIIDYSRIFNKTPLAPAD